MMTQSIVVGIWNVRTLHATGKLNELMHKLEEYRWNILGLAEVRWLGVGDMYTEEGHIGEEKRCERRVVFLVHRNLSYLDNPPRTVGMIIQVLSKEGHYHNFTIANTLQNHKPSRMITWHHQMGWPINQLTSILSQKDSLQV